MLIDTRAMGFALTDAILRYVEARVESVLGPFSLMSRQNQNTVVPAGEVLLFCA